VTDPRGEVVTVAALDVLRDDISALEQAIESPGDGLDDFALPDGGTVWWFSQDANGAQLADAADRIRDFGLLARIGLEPLPARGGAPATESTLWALEEPTRAKHRLLRRYLEAWLPIMSRWERRLVLLEGFAGPGRYVGGEMGSPLIMLDAFLAHRSRHQIDAELVYFFIEDRRDRVDYLEAEIARLDLPDQVKVQVIDGRYEDTFGQLIESVTEAGSKLAPTFAFVDPFGYSHASMDLTGRFLQFERCEVLIFVPLYHVNRFVEREGQERAMTALFGSEDAWRKVSEIGPEQSRMDFLHDLFRDQLHDVSGLRYVRSFEILTGGTNSGYHLFFGTNHIKGLEKMKESMWSVDPTGGQRFQDSTDSDQLVLLEEASLDTQPLRRALRRRFGTDPFTVEEAELFTLEDTAYLPSHLRTRTFKPAEQAGDLEAVDPPATRRRWTYGDRKMQLRFTR
jgi:three-Cys-motif partner protein